MKEISVYEQYLYFTNSFNNIGTFLLSKSIEDIENCIFEEFDGDCISFLNEDFLSVLLVNGLINETVFRLSLELVSDFRCIENTPLWNAEYVKNDPHWLELLTTADKIKSLLTIS